MAEIPYGSHKRQGEKKGQDVKEKIRRAFNRLQSMGLKKTARTYYTMICTRREEARMLKKHGRGKF